MEIMTRDKILEVLNEQLVNFTERYSYLLEELDITRRNIKTCKNHIKSASSLSKNKNRSEKRLRIHDLIIKVLEENPEGLCQIDVFRNAQKHTDENLYFPTVRNEIIFMRNNFIIDMINKHESNHSLCILLNQREKNA